MRSSSIVIASFMACGAVAQSPLSAQVTGVLTEASATVQFRPLADGNPNISQFSGSQIGELIGGNQFGSGTSFSTTSNIGAGVIEFQNGNASGGNFTYATSRTVVDVHFTNDGAAAVRPELHSTITPAGLGLFVGGDCLNNLNGCGPGESFPGNFRTFQSFTPDQLDPATDMLAGASFSFRITGGGTTLYELSGSVMLVRDPLTSNNLLVSDLDAAALALSGFHVTSPTDSQSAFGFAWDATDILVPFSVDTLLLPGESSHLTYETTVSSFSRTQCYDLLTAACVISYASFGDPIGRGGGTNPSLMRSLIALDAAPGGGLTFGAFAFQLPEFHNGVLSYQMIQAAGVPEPASWAMLIAGFGLVGAMRRRQTRRGVRVA